MYMAPPFLAVAGASGEAIKQVEGLRRILWNRSAKLFSHIWDDGKKAFERKAFWGVGNGWAAAGMTRVLQALPDSMGSAKEGLIGYVRDVCGSPTFEAPGIATEGQAFFILMESAARDLGV
jgi:unsaturated rhamnogalacturonyl hydrolase